MHPTWKAALAPEFSKPYFQQLVEYVRQERAAHVVYPAPDLTFAALQMPLDEVCVVILGQDPYHGAGQAHGLAFSVPGGVKPPPSLRNILKELESDLGVTRPARRSLVPWSVQGVLLLNSVLTVRHGEPGSHADHGWETFTDAVLRAVVQQGNPCAFVLWGSYARRKAEVVGRSPDVLTIESAHPSPMSAKGFFGSKPFSRVNRFLTDKGLNPIDWSM